MVRSFENLDSIHFTNIASTRAPDAVSSNGVENTNAPTNEPVLCVLSDFVFSPLHFRDLTQK